MITRLLNFINIFIIFLFVILSILVIFKKSKGVTNFIFTRRFDNYLSFFTLSFFFCIILIILFIISSNEEDSAYLSTNFFEYSDYALFNDTNSFHIFGDFFEFGILATMLLISFFVITLCVIHHNSELKITVCYIYIIFFSGCGFFMTDNLFLIVVYYELFVLPTCILIKLNAKTYKTIEALKFLIVWTQLGAVCLFLSGCLVLYTQQTANISEFADNLSSLESEILALLFFLAFAPKIPCWPFTWWLPEAHVEVSANFSILLSGLTIKFGFLGLIYFWSFFNATVIPTLCILLAFIGIIDATLHLNSCSDLKKSVAYQTVIEMGFFLIFFIFGIFGENMLLESTVQTHCWLTACQFLIVDFVTQRYHTRDVLSLYGILSESPLATKIIFYIVVLYPSVPGCLVFNMEFLAILNFFELPFIAVVFCIIYVFSFGTFRDSWWGLFGGDYYYHNVQASFSFTKGDLLLITFLLLQTTPFAIMELLI